MVDELALEESRAGLAAISNEKKFLVYCHGREANVRHAATAQRQSPARFLYARQSPGWPVMRNLLAQQRASMRPAGSCCRRRQRLLRLRVLRLCRLRLPEIIPSCRAAECGRLREKKRKPQVVVGLIAQAELNQCLFRVQPLGGAAQPSLG